MSEQAQKSNGINAEVWTRIIGAAGGVLILALQGVNISETNGQTSYIQRIDTALEQQLILTREVNHEGQRIDKALENQQHVIENMDVLLHNQSLALGILKEKDGNGNGKSGKPANDQ